MNVWLNKIYRLMLVTAVALAASGPLPIAASRARDQVENNLNQVASSAPVAAVAAQARGLEIPPQVERVVDAAATAASAEFSAPDSNLRAETRELEASDAFTRSLALDGDYDHVRVEHGKTLNDYAHLTLEAWVRRSGGAGCETIISKGRQTDYWLGFCDQMPRFYLGGGYHEGYTTVPTATWTHVAVVWQSTLGSESVSFYVNGQLDGSFSTALSPSKTTNPIYIGANPEASPLEFAGNVAEVRLWGVARSQDEIRRTMHVALEEPLPGLMANWHLSTDYEDNIGGHDGTPQDHASLDGPQAPPQPAVVPIDENFNVLSVGRYDAATVYVPERNQALLIGGSLEGITYRTPHVYAMDASTGVTTTLDPLPYEIGQASAAYVPGNDTVYVFGGRYSSQDNIYAIKPDTGYTRILTATLPNGTRSTASVYHAGLDKVYVIGGTISEGGGNVAQASIRVFDPISETITESLDLVLPQARYGMAAAYSGATGKIYVFGGQDDAREATDTIYEVTVALDGESGTVITLGYRLPQPSYGMSAVEDPVSHLIYLLGGSDTERVLVFDPLTGQVWETPIEVEERIHASAIYSPRNRHALLIGGADAESVSQNNVWRIPLGDGPAVPLGRWDFPALSLPGSTQISAIHGDEDRVLVGTDSDGVWRFDDDQDTLHYTPAALGSASGEVHDVRYEAGHQWAWVATNDAGASVFDGGSDTLTPMQVYTSSELGTDTVLAIDIKPDAIALDDAPFLGTLYEGLRWRSWSYSGWDWETNFAGDSVSDIAHRAPDDAWVISNGYLKHLAYNPVGGGATETSYPGSQCDLVNVSDLVFGPDRDWWLASIGDELSPGGICYIPAAATPGAGQEWTPQALIGDRARDMDVDADGRVWVAFDDSSVDTGHLNGQSGGLVVNESADGAPEVRTEEYNWDDAPLGSTISDTWTLTTTVWESGVKAVGAADERVWAGTEYQELVTLAQRWQQLDESNDMDDKAVTGLWTVRGRLFLATADALHILMPDGKSWDERSGIQARTVLGDSRGRIWVGTDDGLLRYAISGWDTMTDIVGEPPASMIYALAEDLDGRLWIGGADGLTLLDRERFVVTFNTANSDLPAAAVQALLVDQENRLWVGTTAGLARLDNDDSPWTVYTTADGLPGDAIHDLAQLGDGQIAVSTDGGLSLYADGGFSAESLPIDDVNLPLGVDELGRLWAGSAVRTASGWQGYYWTNSGLRHTTVSDNAADGANRVWFSHAPETGVSVRGAFLPPLADTVPNITGIEPQSGTSGDTITIQGSGFGSNPADVSVVVGGAAAEVVSVADDEITVELNDHNTSGGVSVSVDGRRTSISEAFCAIPQFRALSPTGGTSGVLVNIEGSNFDPGAQVTILREGPLGSYSHDYTYHSPTHLTFIIQLTDDRGLVQVENACGDVATSSEEFRHIWLGLVPDHVALNQGMPGYPLIAARPTLIQHYPTHSEAPREDDEIKVSEVEITFTNPDSGESRVYNIPYTGAFTSTSAMDVLDQAWMRDTSTSLNVTLTPYGLGDLLPEGGADLDMTTVLKGDYDSVVALTSRTVHFRPNQVLDVLLVPIMPTGFTQTKLISMTTYVNSGLDELRRRIMPTGDVQFYWSDTVLTRGHRFDLGDWKELWEAGHDMQEIRNQFNLGRRAGSTGFALPGGRAVIAFGIVHEDLLVEGTMSGQAFWADLSMIGNAVLERLDGICGTTSVIVGGICQVFGAECAWECEVDVPLYVGWADGSHGQVSQVLGHEFGHILGLVKAAHANGDLSDNYSHSVNDELDGGECGDLTSGGAATYNPDKTLYLQPGVQEPIYNPIASTQWLPNLSLTRTIEYTDPTTYSVTSEALIWDRAKAIMSYACGRSNSNSFYEPVDLTNIYVEFGVWDISEMSDLGVSLSAADVASKAPGSQVPSVSHSHVISGQRLYVSGVVSQTTPAGYFHTVKAVGEELALSPSFATGYWLVQLDGSGGELSRTGFYPMFNTVASNGDSIEHDSGFFAATLLRQEGLASIELRYDDTVLDTFSAGSAAPVVNITSPTGGVYSSGTIPVTWTASDADGDLLRITIEYSATGTVAWTPVAFGDGSGTVDVPVYQLAGSDEAYFRVSASDGFNSGSATSVAFQVADQPPRPYIGYPTAGATFLEGQQVILSGGASDNQDESVAGDNLFWSSGRDGSLGTGAELGVFLSVGVHTLTLEAENSAGLAATTDVTVTIVGDYDYDSIPDDQELTGGLNPLTERDAYSDADGDGLPLVMERRRGLDPNDPDSDDDGRNDADEIVAGTDPLLDDGPLPPDELEIFPKSLTFEADLSLDIPLPQQLVQVVSREPVTWRLTSDVTWLAATATSGSTVAGSTVLVKAFELEEGVHTGVMTFTSVALGSVVTVPVTATITNADAYFDVNHDDCLNVGDVQDIASYIPTDIGEDDFDYRRDVNWDGEIGVADATLMAQRWETERGVCSAPYPTTTAMVQVMAPTSATLGTTFMVTVQIPSATDLGGFEFDLAFDPTVLQVQAATLGDLLGSSGRTTGELGPAIENTVGVIAFGGYTYGTEAGVSGDGVLAQITFRAIAPGSSTLDIQNPLIADLDGHLTTASGQDAAIEVTGDYHEIYLPFALRDY